MVSLPLFERLDIAKFGLFPGDAQDGLHVKFSAGLTLVIGANGLGKTTLVMILYRLLAGPWEVAGLERGRELGTANLKATAMSRDRRLVISQRVPDAAKEATATLHFKVGKSRLVVERSLHDLSLRRFQINGTAQVLDEEHFKKQLIRLVGVWAFGDWILLLQHLMFYGESRRELVWDASAQRELLRALFLSVAKAEKWAVDAREILTLDSSIRNLSAVRSQMETAIADHASKLSTLPEVRAKLATLEKLQAADRDRREELDDEIDASDAFRQKWRLRQMQLAQSREEAYRDLERAKLLAITAQFPNQSETARYIIAQLATDDICLVCGSKSPKASKSLNQRIQKHACVICGSDVAASRAAKQTAQQVEGLGAKLAASQSELEDATRELEQAEQRHAVVSSEIQKMNAAITERAVEIDGLVSKLPPEEAVLHTKRSDLTGIKALEDQQRAEVAQKRVEFKAYVEETNREIVKQAGKIKDAFHAFARDFLVESCELVWQPQKARLGQFGDTFDFAGFELSMSGAGFSSPIRRSGPEQVSESQREFIDLAFRMALIQAAASEMSGTLVIDAPESSLDAVFAPRAADVLAKFAHLRENRVVVTSNLVDGDLVPRLVVSIPKTQRASRIVDLFENAKKTAAVAKYWPEYKKIRTRLLR